MALCYLTMVLMGVFGFRRIIDLVPGRRFSLLPFLWAALFVPLAVGQYYLDNYLSDGTSRFQGLLVGDPLLLALFASAWVSSYWHRRRGAHR